MTGSLPVALRDAGRALRRSPLFAVMATLSLGLALALNTTMFALVDATLRPHLPFDADQVQHVFIRGGDKRVQVPFESRLEAIRAQRGAFERVTWSSMRWMVVQGGTEQPGNQMVALVPDDFFATIGVRPMLGRTFASGESDAAIISFTAWRRLYAGRPLVSGLTIVVGDRTYPVVGVLPRGMHYPAEGRSEYAGSVWLPAPPAGSIAARTLSFGDSFSPVYARVRPGVSFDQAQQAAEAAAARLTSEFGTNGLDYHAKLYPARGDPAKLSELHRILQAAVFVVLLIACANLATLMLARGVARRREVALRMALGATRGHVMRAVLAESGALAFAGAAVGLVLTVWGLFLLSTQAVRTVPTLGDLEPVPSARVFVFMLGAAVVAMLLCAVLPAFRMANTDPAAPLGDGSGTTTARSRERHGLLVVVQVALGMSLLLGAGALVYEVLTLRGFNSQFDARRLALGSVFLRPSELPEGPKAERLYEDLEARARRVPGVVSAATMRYASPEGAVVTSEEGRAGMRWINLPGYQVVSASYLRTLGVGLVEGRDFEPGDRLRTGAAIIDEEATRRLFPDVKSPVGRMIKLGDQATRAPWVRVIGVARRVDFNPSSFASDVPTNPVIYVLPPRDSARDREVIVRTERPDDVVASLLLNRAMQEVAGPRARVSTRAWLATFRDQQEFFGFLASLFGAFGMFALLLAATGLYGVLGYMVTRRLREFAVRVALGATPRNVVGIVARQATVLTLAGVGVGALGALGAMGPALGMALHAPFSLAIVLVCAELVVFAVASLAAAGPARRAARADPLAVMRAT